MKNVKREILINKLGQSQLIVELESENFLCNHFFESRFQERNGTIMTLEASTKTGGENEGESQQKALENEKSVML